MSCGGEKLCMLSVSSSHALGRFQLPLVVEFNKTAVYCKCQKVKILVIIITMFYFSSILFEDTKTNNLPVNLNNGDNYKECCSAFWMPPIKTHS